MFAGNNRHLQRLDQPKHTPAELCSPFSAYLCVIYLLVGLGTQERTFDNVKNSIVQSGQRLTSTVNAQSSQTRTIIYIVGAVVALAILYKLFW